MSESSYRWKFFRAGGVDQVLLRNGTDLVNLARLDQKLWVALAMPTRGVEFDSRTLDLLDTDKDGRVRAPEIVAAVQWVKETFKNPDDLLKGGDSVALSAIKDGPALVGAKRLLANLGKKEPAVTLADVADTAKVFAATRLNGDGVVPAESAEDAPTAKAIADIISVIGSIPDRSGKPGIDQARLDAFFTEARALSDWHAKAEVNKALLPLSDGTAYALTVLKAVKPKAEDYFTRCRLAAYDARATEPLNRTVADYQAIAAMDLSLSHDEVRRLPLAHVEGGRVMPLTGHLNPAWYLPVTELGEKVVDPLLGPGKHTLSEPDWLALQAKFEPYEAWMATKPATAVEKLGFVRVRELLTQGAQEKIHELIQQDLALEAENAQIALVEKLVRFQRDLFLLLKNFVSFSDFYARNGAIFQAGTLYLDGRSCDLCIHVLDPAKHATLAGMASTFLAYCDCTRPGEKMTIVAAFTDGESDNLIVGRNGVFYDRQGRDWDATITRIVANPISVREAFWAPYKKLVRLVEEQVSKRASTADAEATTKLGSAATATADADKAKRDEVKKIDVGTVAAIGVAVGGIGAMVTGVLGSFFGLGAWMPLGMIAAVLLISGPSMLLGWLKLRQRNLGPILDANGWAINGRAKINVPFGAALTRVAAVPKGSDRSLQDPYAEKRRPWKTYAAVVIVLTLAALWYLGRLDSLLPQPARSVSVLGANAPAATATPPAGTGK